jgi:hypothetical protein
MVMQIAIKVDTGYNCDWRNIVALQPDGFKGQTENEKETLKNSIVKNGFHDAFDVWQHEGRLLSIDGVHRKIALLELSEEGYEIPEQLPCTYVTAANETEAATIILSRNAQHSHILSAAVMTAAFKIPAATIEAVVPQKNLEAWSVDAGVDLDADDYGTDFDLPEGDKAPFQQMTFTLADEQAEQVKNAIADIKQTEEYKYCETLGNENSNGNALYLIIMQWAEQKK